MSDAGPIVRTTSEISGTTEILIFAVSAVVLVAIAMTLLRAIKGPTAYDRILAVNAMGTCSVGLVALMGFVNKRPDFLDIAVVYALVNFIATIAILKFIELRRLD